MAKTKVIIHQKKPDESEADQTYEALKKSGFGKLINSDDKILINPNWIIAEHYSQGNTTSTETLEGIVKFLIQDCHHDPSKIMVGEGGYPRETDEAMRINEVARLADEYGIEVRNINNDKRIEVSPPSPLALKSVKIAESAANADLIISVPSLKVHSMATTTLSMKNLMGLILPKGIMHSNLAKKIADLCSIFRVKMRFSIIDGWVGSDSFEEGGNPVEMNVLLLSEDPVALDAVGSEIMGCKVKDVEYLEYAMKKGLGNANLSDIDIIGPSINSVRKYFSH